MRENESQREERFKCNLGFLSYQCRPFRRRFPVELAWPPAKEIPNRFWPPLPLLKRREAMRAHTQRNYMKNQKEKKRKTEKNGIIIHKNKTLSRPSYKLNGCTRNMCAGGGKENKFKKKKGKVKAKRKQSMPGLLL
jgi:hypothetical protein